MRRRSSERVEMLTSAPSRWRHSVSVASGPAAHQSAHPDIVRGWRAGPLPLLEPSGPRRAYRGLRAAADVFIPAWQAAHPPAQVHRRRAPRTLNEDSFLRTTRTARLVLHLSQNGTNAPEIEKVGRERSRHFGRGEPTTAKVYALAPHDSDSINRFG